MATNHLNEFIDIEPLPARRKKKKTGGNRYLSFVAIVIAVLAHAALTFFLLSQSTSRVYGFPVFLDVRTRIELALQICPMLAAIFMVLTSGARNSVNELLVGRVLASRPNLSERTCRT